MSVSLATRGLYGAAGASPTSLATHGLVFTTSTLLTLAWPGISRATDFGSAFLVAPTAIPTLLDPSFRSPEFLTGAVRATRLPTADDRNAAKLHVQNLTPPPRIDVVQAIAPPADIDVIRDLLPSIASIEDL